MKKKAPVNDESWRLEFPEVTDPAMVFGGYPEDFFQAVMKTYEEGSKNWDRLASRLFFQGGKIPLNEGLNPAYLTNGVRLLKSVLGSYKPKHEHKEHVAGQIMRSLCAKDSEEVWKEK